MGLTTDREDPGLKNIRADGQQEVYLVLSDEERAKGFVRPVRKKYRHVGLPAPKNPLRELTPAEREQYAEFGYAKYEEYPPGGAALGRYWTHAELAKISACGTVTTMGDALAETYARDPQFYGATFCCACGWHAPVGERGEFVWEPDGSRVGT